jgi:hypothetical protein
MSKSICFALAWLLCVGSAQAISLNVPKGLIDIAVAKKFPKEKATITLDKPTMAMSKARQKVELCGSWASKLPKANGDFCIDTQPAWNKDKGDIEISKVNILKLTTADGKELSAAIANTLNATLLTLLDGTSVYHVPDMIGKRLDSIEVQDSGIRLQF